MRRVGRTNKSNTNMLINKITESMNFGLRKRIYHANRRGRTFLQVDLKVVRPVRSQRISLSLAEDISKVMVFLWNMRKIGNFVGDGSRFPGKRRIREVNSKTLHTRKFTST